jgi:transposase-like protein
MQQKIDPKRIRMDLGTQARVQTDTSVVEEYATAMRRGDQFPPLQIFHDLDSDLLVLVDGFHRLEAHLRVRPNEDIDVIIQEGTLSDARWTSFAVNATHGLRRSTADKRRIIAEALRHEKGVKMSDRQIAEHIGVDKNTVASVRRELEAVGEIHHHGNRQGKDGKTYAVKTAKTESQANPEAMTDGVLVALPKFYDGNPEVLLKILLEFFKEDYLLTLASGIHKKFNKEGRTRSLFG